MLSFVIDAAMTLNQQLGIVERVKSKLVRHKDEAAEKLVIVLEEVSKVYLATETELAKFLSLDLSENADLPEARKVLIDMEGGALNIRMEEARGHCHKIGNIHHNYLRTWFDVALETSEAQELNSVFELMSNSDYAMIVQIDQVATWISDEASAVLDLVDSDDLDGARQWLRDARKEVLPARRAMSELLGKVRAVQGDFIEAAGII